MIHDQDSSTFVDELLLKELEQKTGRSNRQEDEIHLTWVEGGEVLGGLYAFCRFETCFLDLLAVDPSARSRKVGSQLMHKMESLCREKGLKYILLNTQDYQAPEFYRKLGYEETAAVKDVPFEGTPRYYFKKRL